MASNIDKRRKLRSLEASRDKHLTQIQVSKTKLASIRAELKHLRAKK